MTMDAAKIELIDLQLQYPTVATAADDEGAVESGLAVDLRGTAGAPPVRIAPGEFSVILGPSGCGKSSLLRMVGGLAKPTAGTVLKDGQPVTGPGRDRGMVFQSYTSFPWLDVENNVLFGPSLTGDRGVKNAATREKLRNIIALVELSDSMHKYPRELSGGMKQRVAIARALINEPDVLLMDEPFGALDPHIRVKMQDLMLEIEKRLDTTIVFVTHDAREAVYLGDTIYISTLRPCFLKYRIEHPFKKANLSRAVASRRYANDFLRFQRDVEDRMQYLIEHRDVRRVIENEDQGMFERSSLGMLEQLTSGIDEG